MGRGNSWGAAAAGSMVLKKARWETRSRWNQISPGSKAPNLRPFELPDRSQAALLATCKCAVGYVTKPFPWPAFLKQEARKELIEAAAAIQSIRTVRSYGSLIGWRRHKKLAESETDEDTTPRKFRVSGTIEVPIPEKRINPYTKPFLVDID